MLPTRKRLYHTPPPDVSSGAVFFLTVCCAQRGANSLAHDEVFQVLVSTTEYYLSQQRWHAHLLLAMPDHFHALASFPVVEEMGGVMRDWKRWTAKKAGIKWQDGFFDHRLRTEESFDEKAHYIRMNPFRAGLSDADSWKYIWLPTSHAAR